MYARIKQTSQFWGSEYRAETIYRLKYSIRGFRHNLVSHVPEFIGSWIYLEFQDLGPNSNRINFSTSKYLSKLALYCAWYLKPNYTCVFNYQNCTGNPQCHRNDDPNFIVVAYIWLSQPKSELDSLHVHFKNKYVCSVGFEWLFWIVPLLYISSGFIFEIHY